MVKVVGKFAEESKVAVRNIRRDCKKTLTVQKDGLSEDLCKDKEADLQQMTDDYVKKIEGVNKEKEITTVYGRRERERECVCSCVRVRAPDDFNCVWEVPPPARQGCGMGANGSASTETRQPEARPPPSPPAWACRQQRAPRIPPVICVMRYEGSLA